MNLQTHLEVYSWTLGAVLVAFMAGIAVFYEMKFQTTTHYRLFFIPIIMLLVAALHLSDTSEVLKEIVEFVGAVSAMLLSLKLYYTMTRVK